MNWQEHLKIIAYYNTIIEASDEYVWYIDEKQKGYIETASGAIFPCNTRAEFMDIVENIDDFAQLD